MPLVNKTILRFDKYEDEIIKYIQSYKGYIETSIVKYIQNYKQSKHLQTKKKRHDITKWGAGVLICLVVVPKRVLLQLPSFVYE